MKYSHALLFSMCSNCCLHITNENFSTLLGKSVLYSDENSRSLLHKKRTKPPKPEPQINLLLVLRMFKKALQLLKQKENYKKVNVCYRYLPLKLCFNLKWYQISEHMTMSCKDLLTSVSSYVIITGTVGVQPGVTKNTQSLSVLKTSHFINCCHLHHKSGRQWKPCYILPAVSMNILKLSKHAFFHNFFSYR